MTVRQLTMVMKRFGFEKELDLKNYKVYSRTLNGKFYYVSVSHEIDGGWHFNTSNMEAFRGFDYVSQMSVLVAEIWLRRYTLGWA